jgi:hypothetical protein
MKKIKDDPNLPLSMKVPSQGESSPANQAKAQEDARVTTIDGTPALTPWVQVSCSPIDIHASRAEPADKNPIAGYSKRPDMPKPASNKNLKVNY